MNKKEIIVEKAIELFAENGYETTSIQKLSEACGVAQGLLYRHFKNKEALLAHLLELGMLQIIATLQPYLIADSSFKQAFREHVKLCFRLLETKPLLWKVLHSVRQNALLMKSLGGAGDMQQVVGLIQAKLEQDRYERPGATALVVIALIDGLAAMYLLHPDSFTLPEIEDLLVNKIEQYA